MSRKMLITLIVVMAAVLSGLIFVQIKMIKSASDIREEQFNQLVTNALLLVSAQLNQIEEREARLNAQLQKLPIEDEIAKDFNVADSGYRMLVNVNKEGGQVIYHVHFHVLGGKLFRFEQKGE